MKSLRWLIGFLLAGASALAAEVAPLVRAHAHNDYEHARPLADALERGFGSVEADVHLVDGKLLVAHDLAATKPERTLTALYLEPLRARVRANGGRVYRDGPAVILLVDVKSEAAATFAALHAVLKDYADMLTVFRDGVAKPGAITVIVSGNRARAVVAAQPLRYAAIDGRREDLDATVPAALVPLVSMSWDAVFPWKWEGAMPDPVRTGLKDWVERAHAQGKKVRFWNTPDKPETWRVLLDAGVDLIGTDDLAGLAAFLNSRSAR